MPALHPLGLLLCYHRGRRGFFHSSKLSETPEWVYSNTCHFQRLPGEQGLDLHKCCDQVQPSITCPNPALPLSGLPPLTSSHYLPSPKTCMSTELSQQEGLCKPPKKLDSAFVCLCGLLLRRHKYVLRHNCNLPELTHGTWTSPVKS